MSYVTLKKTNKMLYIVLKDGGEINNINNWDELIGRLIDIQLEKVSTIGCVTLLGEYVIENVKITVDDFLSKEGLEKIYGKNTYWYYVFESESLLDLPISSIPKKIYNEDNHNIFVEAILQRYYYGRPMQQYGPNSSSFYDPMHLNTYNNG